MPALTFRARILLAVMLAVAAVTGATVLATQRGLAAAYERVFAERFQNEIDHLSTLQEARLAAVKARCQELARSVRLVAATAEGDAQLLYRIALDELRDVLTPAPSSGRRAVFFRLLDADGQVLTTADERAGRSGPWLAQLARAGSALTGDAQAVGYLVPEIDGQAELVEVVLTRIVDPVGGRALGALALGFAISEPETRRGGAFTTGVLLGDRLHAASVPPAWRRRSPPGPRASTSAACRTACCCARWRWRPGSRPRPRSGSTRWRRSWRPSGDSACGSSVPGAPHCSSDSGSPSSSRAA